MNFRFFPRVPLPHRLTVPMRRRRRRRGILSFYEHRVQIKSELLQCFTFKDISCDTSYLWCANGNSLGSLALSATLLSSVVSFARQLRARLCGTNIVISDITCRYRLLLDVADPARYFKTSSRWHKIDGQKKFMPIHCPLLHLLVASWTPSNRYLLLTYTSGELNWKKFCILCELEFLSLIFWIHHHHYRPVIMYAHTHTCITICALIDWPP